MKFWHTTGNGKTHTLIFGLNAQLESQSAMAMNNAPVPIQSDEYNQIEHYLSMQVLHCACLSFSCFLHPYKSVFIGAQILQARSLT